MSGERERTEQEWRGRKKKSTCASVMDKEKIVIIVKRQDEE